MRFFAIALGLTLAGSSLAAAPAAAQPRPDPKRAEIDNLLNALKIAPSEEAAAALEARLRQTWNDAASPAAALLMNRGLRDLHSGAQADAVADFDAVLALDPDLTVAFQNRAVARFSSGDYVGALRDIEAALQREPRNFAAFQALSRIAEARGDLKGALAAWQKLLEVDPNAPDGKARLKALTRKVRGEDT